MERDLVAHRAGHQIDRGFLARDRRRALLETEHGGIVVVLGVADVGVRHRPAHLGRRTGDRVGAKIGGHGPTVWPDVPVPYEEAGPLTAPPGTVAGSPQ